MWEGSGIKLVALSAVAGAPSVSQAAPTQADLEICFSSVRRGTLASHQMLVSFHSRRLAGGGQNDKHTSSVEGAGCSPIGLSIYDEIKELLRASDVFRDAPVWRCR